ncbi:arylsulfatase [Sphingopyxis granuli]|uniref:arylsulfatase n=1 Tax=Sphingopyxis granuli TaxID=267128 RepID=UPI001F52E8A4|nr:arylsulfatase [Sphingopyxis granuli]UNK80519.1 arylsulfatase [Sphingopyxis granuli]
MLAVFLGLSAPAAAAGKVAEKRPNILLILADDLGYSDIAPYGGEIPTPNLSWLAGQGLALDNFYASPSCSPTRAMLLTGQDHHRVGFGSMEERIAPNQIGRPGYETYLNARSVSVAALLRRAGYLTAMAGKWHLGAGEEHSPAANGFDRSFVLLEGAGSHFPDRLGTFASEPVAHYRENGRMVERLPSDFFSTRFYTDYILSAIDESRRERTPFFAYLTYTAPHWPLQAPDAYLRRAQGRYDAGHEAIWRQRLARMMQLGILNAGQAAPAHFSRAWQDMPPADRAVEAKRMEIYSAMVEQMDDEIGRVIRHLADGGDLANTLILFLSDNGAEGVQPDRFPRNAPWVARTFDNSIDNMGRAGSYISYGPDWAAVSAAPYGGSKGSVAEGGIKVPAIITGPALGIRRDERSAALMTIRDLPVSLLTLAGVKAPDSYSGRSILAHARGRQPRVHRAEELFGWELHGSRAMRQGDWKLSRPASPQAAWQLFDLAADPGETRDIAAAKPSLAARLAEYWRRYAAANGVVSPEPSGVGR